MSYVQSILKNLHGDRMVWIVFGLLCGVSLLSVYSSSSIMGYRMDVGSSHIAKHILLIGAAGFVAYVLHLIPFRKYSGLAPMLLLISVGLLILTMVAGSQLNYARRWLTIPLIGLRFQTSDLAKVAIVLYLARNIATKQAVIKNFKTAFIPLLVPVLVITMLIAPSDLASALILFATCLIMLFVGRIQIKYIALVFAFGLICLSFIIMLAQFFPDLIQIRDDTWMTRITNFTSGNAAMDTVQAKIAIAQGGWFGLGPGNSVQRNFIAYPYADYIYAIIAEEYGMIGAFTILGAYIVLLFRCTKLLTRSRQAFGALLGFGLCMGIVLQALANISVSVDLVPATGVTLPMVSMGGTSLIFTAVQFGIILSVSRDVEENGLHLKNKTDESDD